MAKVCGRNSRESTTYDRPMVSHSVANNIPGSHLSPNHIGTFGSHQVGGDAYLLYYVGNLQSALVRVTSAQIVCFVMNTQSFRCQ